MDREKVNTSQFELLPEGHYVFKVTEKPEKRPTAKSSFRIWRFTHEEGGAVKKFSTVLFPWKSRDMLLACGGTLVGNTTVDIDWDSVAGKVIECDVIHEPNQEDEMKEVLINIESIDMPKQVNNTQEPVGWDA
jgi:hypothetical protein